MYKYIIATALCAASLPALAGDITELKGGSIHLGKYAGVVYYEATPEGYKVVTTLATADSVPIRVITTLGEGQQVLISVPGKVGEPDKELVIIRDADKIIVTEPIPEMALAE